MYDTKLLEAKLGDAREMMVVLESDREYKLHLHDTEFDHQGGIVQTEGLQVTEGRNQEYAKVEFPASAVEHVYVHKEN